MHNWSHEFVGFGMIKTIKNDVKRSSWDAFFGICAKNKNSAKSSTILRSHVKGLRPLIFLLQLYRLKSMIWAWIFIKIQKWVFGPRSWEGLAICNMRQGMSYDLPRMRISGFVKKIKIARCREPFYHPMSKGLELLISPYMR